MSALREFHGILLDHLRGHYKKEELGELYRLKERRRLQGLHAQDALDDLAAVVAAVEDRPGHKNPASIADFLTAVAAL